MAELEDVPHFEVALTCSCAGVFGVERLKQSPLKLQRTAHLKGGVLVHTVRCGRCSGLLCFVRVIVPEVAEPRCALCDRLVEAEKPDAVAAMGEAGQEGEG